LDTIRPKNTDSAEMHQFIANIHYVAGSHQDIVDWHTSTKLKFTSGGLHMLLVRKMHETLACAFDDESMIDPAVFEAQWEAACVLDLSVEAADVLHKYDMLCWVPLYEARTDEFAHLEQPIRDDEVRKRVHWYRNNGYLDDALRHKDIWKYALRCRCSVGLLSEFLQPPISLQWSRDFMPIALQRKRLDAVEFALTAGFDDHRALCVLSQHEHPTYLKKLTRLYRKHDARNRDANSMPV
jgi:hypothetical protein